MATLQGKTIKDTYKDLLQVSNSNSGVDTTLRTIEDGEGTSSALQVSTTNVKVNGDLDVTGSVTGVPHIDYRGNFSSGTAYAKDDVVVYNGSTYISKGNTTGNLPTSTSHWGLLASKGDDGVGADGTSISTASINSSGNLILSLSDGSTIDCGTAKGADGIGADGVSVQSGSINSSGNLILTLTNGSTINCGLVKGTNGADGANGVDGVSVSSATINSSGNLILTLSNGNTINCGTAKGADGANGTNGTNGANGVSVTNATINSSGNLILTLSNGTSINCGQAQGSSGTIINSGIAKFLSSGVVINENSADIDFRVEGNGDANLIRTDAGNDLVAFGQNPNTSNTWGGSNNYKFKAQARDSLCVQSTSGTAKLQLYSSASSNASANLQWYAPQHADSKLGNYSIFVGASYGEWNLKNEESGRSLKFNTDTFFPYAPSLMFGLHDPMDLGSVTNKWRDIYCNRAAFNGSDRNLKQDIEELSEAEKRVAVKCKGLVRKYRLKDSVTRKGEDARIHIGIIAQELQEVFESEGLDAFRYSMIGRDTWYNGYDSNGEFESVFEPKEGYTEVTQYQVRYTELLAFIISAI
jgi:hypothetical protein